MKTIMPYKSCNLLDLLKSDTIRYLSENILWQFIKCKTKYFPREPRFIAEINN